jgi:hypothetical protein
MAVSKRLRYEVLKRDGHACRYCGRTAPEVKLTIDHVVPTTLGGSDDPDNLVTACSDCNSGKSSSNPDAPLVANVAEDALRWAQAQRAAAAAMLKDLGRRQEARGQFRAAWNEWSGGPKKVPIPLPSAWEASVDQMLAAGLPLPILTDCITVAMNARNVTADNTFRYCCGVAWKRVRELNDAASAEVFRQQPGTSKPEYPVMYIADATVMELCRVLGHSDDVAELATRALWTAAAEGQRAFDEATGQGLEFDDALDEAEDQASSAAAYHLFHAGKEAKEGRH